MQLYRMMANVQAGAGQPNAKPGQLGLVTVWVRSDSEEQALSRARDIIQARNYQSAGELTIYLEETTTLPAAADPPERGTRGGYLNMRHEATERGDGLFELWYPAAPNKSGK